MFKIKFLIVFLLSISINLFSKVDNGVLDISGYDFKINPPINLNGLWEVELENGNKILSEVPGNWSFNKKTVTYRLRIYNNKTEHLIIIPTQINSKYIMKLNKVTIIEEQNYRYLYIPITINNGENILEFIITNINDPKGGIRNTPVIGSLDQMYAKYEEKIFHENFFTGSSMIISLFFFILFFKSREKKEWLYFSLLSLAISTRGLVTNNKTIFEFFPSIPGFMIQRIEYLCVYSLPLLFMLFIKNSFKFQKHIKIQNIIISILGVFPLLTLISPGSVYKSILYIYFIIAGISILLGTLFLVIYIKNKLENSIKILVCLLLIGFGAFYDISVMLFSTNDTHILSFTLIFFILFMVYNLFRNELIKLKKFNNLSIENVRVNKYLSKFVPNAFFKTVGLGDLLTIKNGDGVEKRMTVLFASIKGFQNEIKFYKAEETISVLNRCYSIISPIVTKYGGFVDKFIDETMMALFPNKPEDGINAVIEIYETLELHNKTNPLLRPIEMQSGIHIGEQYIGIVGDKKRVDATVISKVVNTASRIHSFTKILDKNILISDDVYQEVKDKETYKMMFMGRVKLKGNMNFIGIHSVNIKPTTEADNLFSITMRKLDYSSLYEIEDVLLRIKRLHKEHTPTNYYLNLIETNKVLEVLDK